MSNQTSAEGPGLSQKLFQVDPLIFRRIDKTLFGSSKLSDGARTWRVQPQRLGSDPKGEQSNVSSPDES
jgi:hypothetical protein